MDDSNLYVLLERNLRIPVLPIPLHGEYRIRPFATGDASVWTAIQNRVFEPHKAQNFRLLYGEKFSGEGIFFAQHGHDAVGIAAGILKKTPHGTPFWVVDWVGVLEEHRRHGIAGVLVTYVLEYIKSRGLPFAYLATPAYRENGIALYRKLGFDLISRDEKERIDELQIRRADTVLLASGVDVACDREGEIRRTQPDK